MVARIGKPIPYDAYKNFSVDELRDIVRNAIIDLQEMDTIA
jgi:hypothetical protein